MLPRGSAPAGQPIRASELMSVLRLISKVRQTAAFVAPPSSAATTAAIFSASIATAAAAAAASPGSGKAGSHPLLGQRSLELRQRPEDVKRRAIGTPDRRAKGTPFQRRDRLVSVANRRAPRASRSAPHERRSGARGRCLFAHRGKPG